MTDENNQSIEQDVIQDEGEVSVEPFKVLPLMYDTTYLSDNPLIRELELKSHFGAVYVPFGKK